MINKILKDYLPISYEEMRGKNFLKNMNKSNIGDIKRVRKGKGLKKVKKCDLCGKSKFNFLIKKNTLNIVKCDNCNLVFSEMIPNLIDDLYSDKKYLENTLKSYDKNSNFRKKRFGNERVQILQKYKKSGKLLDIGCGVAWFLEVANKFYNAEGIEVSDDIREYVLKNKNIRTYKYFNDTKNMYDVITAFDLLEHVKSPLEILKQIRNRLNPGGISLIFTPNVDSIGFEVLKEKNSLLCPPAHLYYFNKESMEKYSRKLGLEVINIWTMGIDVGDIYAKELSLGHTEVAKFLKNNQNWIQHSIDKAGLGNHMRILLRKPKK